MRTGCRFPSELARVDSARGGLLPMSGSDRPTAMPPFDPDAFARESESQLRSARPQKLAGATAAESFARFGTKASVPWLTVSFEELRTMPLDHRAGFLVSLV